MLKVKDLSWHYSSKKALHGVNFEMEKGQILGLLGENGAGKSTLLKLLAGIYFPQEGHIQLDKQSLMDDPAVYRQKVSYLPEGVPLYEKRSLGEYLYSQAELWECSNQRFRSLLDLAQLEEVWNQPMGKLSRGYRQRCGLVRCLMASSPMILLDEPFSGLDPKQVLQFREFLQKEAQDRWILFSSHILPEVYALCHRILVFKEGTLLQDQQRSDLASQEELEALFQESQ